MQVYLLLLQADAIEENQDPSTKSLILVSDNLANKHWIRLSSCNSYEQTKNLFRRL